MKITEIIQEERTDEFLGAAGRLAWQAGKALFRNPKAADTAADMVSPASRTQAMRTAIDAVKKAGLDPNGFLGKLMRNKIYRDGLKQMSIHRATAQAEMIGRLSETGLDFAKLLYVADSIYDYYTAKAILDAKKASGELSDGEYEDELTKLRGQLIAGYLAPKIAGGLTRLTAGNAVNLFGWVVKTAGLPKQAILLRAAKDVAIKAGQAGLLAFFSTDKGRDWLTNNFKLIVTGLGNAGDFAAEFLDYAKAAYQVATGDLPPGFEKNQDKDKEKPDSNPWTSGSDLGLDNLKKDPWKGTGVNPGVL
jgi:hypothetical protein